MAVPDLSHYDDWLGWLRRQGQEDPDVLVVWVGGSTATGGYDEWSDLDLDVLVTPGTHDATSERLLARVHDDFEVDHVWEVPVAARLRPALPRRGPAGRGGCFAWLDELLGH